MQVFRAASRKASQSKGVYPKLPDHADNLATMKGRMVSDVLHLIHQTH